MSDLNDKLNILKGITKPVKYTSIFTVSLYDNPRLIICDGLSELMNDFGSNDLLELLTNTKNLPTEHGVYRADLFVHSFKCNHPEDPSEWDMTIWLENIEKIKL